MCSNLSDHVCYKFLTNHFSYIWSKCLHLPVLLGLTFTLECSCTGVALKCSAQINEAGIFKIELHICNWREMWQKKRVQVDEIMTVERWTRSVNQSSLKSFRFNKSIKHTKMTIKCDILTGPLNNSIHLNLTVWYKLMTEFPLFL